jgi:hypothetical protein
MDRNQKLGNRKATGKHKPAPSIAGKAYLVEDGITADPEKCIQHVEQTFRAKTASPDGDHATGAYYDHTTAVRQYPFPKGAHRADGCASIMDRKAIPERHWLHAAIDDECAFHQCLASLNHGKAPGPDGVPACASQCATASLNSLTVCD